MRPTALVVITLLAVPACTREDAAPARAGSAGPEALTAPAPLQPAPAVPQVSRWELDPENSSVTFVSKHVYSNVRGMFARPSGSVTLDDATPANSKITATVELNLLSTGVEERDTHLKSADFFEVAKYPIATFASTRVTRSSAAAYEVAGNLTLHGVTRPVTLAVSVSPPFNHAGGVRRGIEATTTLNRRDFAVLWDFPGEGSGVVVGDNIKVTVDAELVLQGEPAPAR